MIATMTSARAAIAAGAIGAVLGVAAAATAQDAPWYTQGDFAPSRRIAFELTNTLDIDRVNVPVVIRRDQMPIADLHELQVTVVDPALPPAPEPSPERLKLAGGHELRREANGQNIAR